MALGQISRLLLGFAIMQFLSVICVAIQVQFMHKLAQQIGNFSTQIHLFAYVFGHFGEELCKAVGARFAILRGGPNRWFLASVTMGFAFAAVERGLFRLYSTTLVENMSVWDHVMADSRAIVAHAGLAAISLAVVQFFRQIWWSWIVGLSCSTCIHLALNLGARLIPRKDWVYLYIIGTGRLMACVLLGIFIFRFRIARPLAPA